MKKSLLFVLTGIAAMLLSCTANKHSFKRDGEEVHLRFNHQNDTSWPEHLDMQSVYASIESEQKTRGLEAIMAVPFVVKVAYNQIEKAVSQEDKKRTAVYFSSSSDDWFYLNTQEKSPVNLKNIVFYRTIKTKRSDTDTAIVMQFGLQRSWDGMFLRFGLERMKVYYAKAKLPRKDNRLDMDITINITSFAVQKEGSGPEGDVKPFTITVYNIPLGREVSPEALKNYVSPWFPMIPRSSLAGNKYGTGNFGISVKATEYAEYGEQIVKIDEKYNLSGNKDEINGLIDEITKNKLQK